MIGFKGGSSLCSLYEIQLCVLIFRETFSSETRVFTFDNVTYNNIIFDKHVQLQISLLICDNLFAAPSHNLLRWTNLLADLESMGNGYRLLFLAICEISVSFLKDGQSAQPFMKMGGLNFLWVFSEILQSCWNEENRKRLLQFLKVQMEIISQGKWSWNIDLTAGFRLTKRCEPVLFK